MVDVLSTSLDTQVILDRLENIIRDMPDGDWAKRDLERLKLDIEIHLRRAGVPFR